MAPPIEGALAPDPARAKAAPLRDIPALRKRDKAEKTWKDEVRERVQKRKRKPKAGGDDEPELPIFGEPEPQAALTEPPVEAPIEEPAQEPMTLGDAPEPDSFVSDLELRPAEPTVAEEPAAEPEDEPELPLRSAGPIKLDIPEPEAYDPLSEEPAPLEEPEPERSADDDDDGWQLEDGPPSSDARPVERPAQFAERLEAGAVDAAVLGGLAAVVIYFASRAAHVPLQGLLPVWPWLSGYLALLGLAYASYFTGTTGQTPGKMLFGLRVVEASGGPPSYPRALVRAAAGAFGSLLAGAFVLPLFFDPARRALHDRLFRTRVVKY